MVSRQKVVSLVAHDSERPNLALMKLSSYYKDLGWGVNLDMPLFPADKTYVSRLFTFSPEIVLSGSYSAGGPGHSLSISLPEDVDQAFPDYSLYHLDHSIGYTSRGCPNTCGFCVVPESEGSPYSVGDIYSFWDNQHDSIVIMDSNILFDYDHFYRIAEQIKKESLMVKFEQGLDIRRIDDRVSRVLAGMKYKRYSISWDSAEVEAVFFRNVEKLGKHVSLQRVSVHILMGYDTDIAYDYYRVCEVKKLGLTCFAMVYDKRRDSPILTHLARWTNSYHITHLPFSVYMANERSLHTLHNSGLSFLLA